MNIAIDCRLPFYQRGGISQYTLQLIPALSRLDSENAYALFHMGKDPDDYTPGRANFRRENAITPCHHRLEQWAFAAEVAFKGPAYDILHSPDFIPPRFGAKRRVITVHDLNFFYFPEFLTAESLRYYKGQIDRAVRVADHISADSEKTRLDLIELLGVPPEKITTVYLSVHPIYQQSYSPEVISTTLATHNLSSGFIMAVGTLEPRKNLPMLFQAYHQLREGFKVDVPLVLVGRRGWLTDEIDETIERLKLSPHIRHLTGIDNTALAHLYHAAGVLVTPSHYEGFGLPALEALNCGCPIIVSDRGSLPEIAGDAGKVLPADDIGHWAHMLNEVLQNNLLREGMIQRGFTHAATFSWETAAQQTLKIYNQVGGAA